MNIYTPSVPQKMSHFRFCLSFKNRPISSSGQTYPLKFQNYPSTFKLSLHSSSNAKLTNSQFSVPKPSCGLISSPFSRDRKLTGEEPSLVTPAKSLFHRRNLYATGKIFTASVKINSLYLWLRFARETLIFAARLLSLLHICSVFLCRTFSMNNRGGNEESQITDNGTEVLVLEEQSYHNHHEELQALGCSNEKSAQECSSTRNQNVDASSPAKATSMGRVMEFFSRLPGIDEGDDLWMNAYDFLAESKAARELLVSRRVHPNIKVKWLVAKVKKFKN